MKRIFILCMVFILTGVSLGVYPLYSSESAPEVKVCMRSDTTGLPVAGLTVTNFSLKYTLSTGYLSSALVGEADAYNDAWHEPTGGKVGVYEEITSGSTGVGTYRIYLPAAFMTGAAAHQTRTISVIDSTGGARSILLAMFDPPNDAVLIGGNTPTTIPSNFSAFALDASGHVILQDDSLTSGKIAASGALEIANASALAMGTVATYTSTTTITLDTGAVANANYYLNCKIEFYEGTGAGQSTTIAAYTVGRECTLNPALDTAISTDTKYRIVGYQPAVVPAPAGSSSAAIITGTARDTDGTGSTLTQIQLADTVAGTPETHPYIYNGYMVRITNGAGAGQVRRIVYYSGHSILAISDNICMIWPPFQTAPDGTSEYEIIPGPGIYDSFNGIATVTASGSTKRRIIVTGYGSFPIDNETGMYGTVYYFQGSLGSTVRFPSAHICTGAFSNYIDIFPALTNAPTDYDYIIFVPSFGGMIPDNIRRNSQR